MNSCDFDQHSLIHVWDFGLSCANHMGNIKTFVHGRLFMSQQKNKKANNHAIHKLTKGDIVKLDL